MIREAIVNLGSILALLAATLVSMAIAGIFKELSGRVKRIWKKLSRKGYIRRP